MYNWNCNGNWNWKNLTTEMKLKRKYLYGHLKWNWNILYNLNHTGYCTRFRHFRLNCLGVGQGVPKIWGTLGTQPFGIGVWLTPASPMCYHTRFPCSRSNCLAVDRGPKNLGMLGRVPKNLGTLGPRPLKMGAWLTPGNIPSHMCYHTKFCHFRSLFWHR